jgi:hypothetical protein
MDFGYASSGLGARQRRWAVFSSYQQGPLGSRSALVAVVSHFLEL